MNSIEVASLLRENKFTKQYFKGVYPGNLLPKQLNKTAKKKILVVNTEANSNPGHWYIILLGRRNRTIELFDSLGGVVLQTNKFCQNFIQKHQPTRLITNNTQLQSNSSDVCGEFCLLFALHRSKGKSFQSFMKLFNPANKSVNDKIARYLFTQYFVLKTGK